jgi:hypothetical protein
MHRFMLTALTTAALSAGAVAQTAPAQSIEVRGSTLRTDVRALCPAIDNELHDALVKTVQEVATAAVMDVRFELAGTRIAGVSTGAGPLRYQRAVKRAVRGLECNGGTPAAQTVALRVRFVDPFDRSATRAVALVEGHAAAR